MTKIVNSEFINQVKTPVVNRINMLIDSKMLTLPKDYNWENAVNFAIEAIKETKDKNDKPALQVCTPKSIQEAIYKTVIEGLNPAKKQCYYIIRGSKLCCDRSYFGNQMLAKRVGGLKSINPVLIYRGDMKDFVYEIDPDTGATRIISHRPKLENQKESEIVGAYAVLNLVDGSRKVEIMTIDEITTSWKQGAQKGAGATHQNFRGQMAKRTVINRACVALINSSTDANLLLDEVDDQEENLSNDPTANGSEVGFYEFEDVPDDAPQQPTQSDPSANVQKESAGPVSQGATEPNTPASEESPY